MLYIFGGLPGVGKSTLAAALAHRLGAVYLRVDTVEQTMRNAGADEGEMGYAIANQLALDNLRLSNPVVADSVNSIEITRTAWRNVAASAGCTFVEIEVICSELEEHRDRIKSRASDIPGLKLPTWKKVIEREYEPWETEPIVVDTAGQSIEQSIAAMLGALDGLTTTQR